MADILQDQFQLLTLRCSVDQRFASGEQQRRQFVALCQLYQGDKVLGPETRTPLSHLGLGPALKPELHGDPFPSLDGTAVAEQLFMAKSLLQAQGAPLWLHIARDAYQLAALPWEELIAAVADLRVLRVPNFLDNPGVPKALPTIAICASAPHAKITGLDDTMRGTCDVLDALNSAFISDPIKPAVHIFADFELQNKLSSLGSQRFKDLNVVIAPYPATSAAAAAQSSPASDIESPWLRWMSESLAGKVVDPIHFVCPGYFQEGNGAIALPETPLVKADAKWARFVCAHDLTTLYNRLGCNIMGFTNVTTEPWNIGLRLLAFQLSWLRAGPVLLADYRDPPGTLPAIYEMLLKAGRPKVLAPSRTQLACHPDVLSYQSSIPRSSGAIDECLLAIGRGAQSAQDVMPGLKVGLESTLDEKDVLAPASGQYLANLRAQLREIDEPSNFKKLEIEGSARALSFLEDLLKKSS